jgi:metal-responsive CopG/Arc/MetJ family transcriptional regulator
MARISASIPEDLKDELYRAADETGQAISHIIAEALRSHLDSPDPGPSRAKNGAPFDSSRLESQVSQLTVEVQGLKELLGSRTPPRGVRFF